MALDVASVSAWLGGQSPDWGRIMRRGLVLSLVVHVFLLFFFARLVMREPGEPREILIPLRVVPDPGAVDEPETEAELDDEIKHLRKQTHPRVRETLREEARVLALSAPPEDVVLSSQAQAGGYSFQLPDRDTNRGFVFGGRGGGTAGTGLGIGNAQGGPGTFQEYVGGLRQIGLEVVFVVDSTGSMGWLIEAVKVRVRELSGWIRELVPVTRFGIVAYRDDDDPEFLTRVQPLTLSVRKLELFLGDLESRGGGDVPEAVRAGLRVAIEKAGWTRDTKKVIVIIGDAPPHPAEMASTLELAREFRARGGAVTTVDVSFDANPEIAAAMLGKRVEELHTISGKGVMAQFREVADAGGGDFSSLEGDREVVRQLAVLIFGKRWAEAVRPMLGEL